MINYQVNVQDSLMKRGDSRLKRSGGGRDLNPSFSSSGLRETETENREKVNSFGVRVLAVKYSLA